MQLVPFVAGVLAVWRLSHLVVVEDGPWNLFLHLRNAAAQIGLGRLFGCFLCFSVWAAVPFALLLSTRWRDLALLIPGMSGGAILLERATQSPFDPPEWIEEPEKEKR